MKASFSRKDVMETVGITATPASNLLRRLKEFELIEPVSGIGRGRYMFAMTKQE